MRQYKHGMSVLVKCAVGDAADGSLLLPCLRATNSVEMLHKCVLLLRGTAHGAQGVLGVLAG
jgi:hypothetical protein